MPLEVETFLLPDENDILQNDVTENQFHSVETELGVSDGSHVMTRNIEYPIKGLIMGAYSRMWIPLIVSKRNNTINAVFLYDTGSPYTHLSQHILEKLGYVDHIPENVVVNIQGVNMNVYLSKNHFEHINLLGQDFMKLAGLDVAISYHDLTFEFNKYCEK